MSGTHSLLAPSDAQRWARCAGALLLSKGRDKPTTVHAASGTCTHWLGWNLGQNNVAPEEFLGKEMEFDGFKFTIDHDRCERARAYVTNVLREPAALRLWEHRVDTAPILGVLGQEGHSDCVALDPLSMVLIDGKEHTGVLTVHDLKDGLGHIVYAKNNLQGLIYGAAALYEFDFFAAFNAIRFCIHQPNANHYSEWTYSRMEIEHFTSIIRPAAKLAYDLFHGNVDFVPAVHLNAGEEQCTWCPVRGSCPARAKRIVDMFASLAVKHEIDDSTLSDIYVRLDEIESACKDFRGEALARALQGRTITGQKLVQAKKGRRFWKDPKKAVETLSVAYDDSVLYHPPELKSPPQLEEELGKKAFKQLELSPFIDQNPGGYSLAPLDDPRKPITLVTFDVLPETGAGNEQTN